MLSIDIALDRPGFGLALCQDIPLHGVTAITGASGSGKTTLLRALAGLEPGVTGRVGFDGSTWQGDGQRLPTHLRRLGVVFQDARLFPHLDVAGNLAYGARRRGVAATHVDRVVSALDIAALLTRRTTDLSGGEARRVAVARALACDPQLLMLDEPLSGLDRDRQAGTLAVIGDAVRKLGVPALYVSHSKDEVAALADRVLLLRDGQGQGWQPPPLGLKATVTEARTLRVGGSTLPAPEGCAVGCEVLLTFAHQDVVITENPPGLSSAPLTVRATVDAAENADSLSLRVDDQRLSLPLPALLSGPSFAPQFGPRTEVWLAVTRFWIRITSVE